MFKNILAEQWQELGPALQQHYGLHDGDTICMTGKLTVKHGKYIKLLMPIIRLTGALVPVEGEDFNVKVTNRRQGDNYFWNREFEKTGKIYEFNSKMQQINNNLIEFAGFGIGIKMGIEVSNNGLLYIDRGYVLKIYNLLIPMPLGLLMGKSVIEEFETTENTHDINMSFIVQHPWFGFVFSYISYFDFNEVNMLNN